MNAFARVLAVGALALVGSSSAAQAESMLFMDNFIGHGMGELYTGPTSGDSIAPFTTYSSRNDGRVRLYGGGLLMDVDANGRYNLNEANLVLNLEDWEGIRVTFNHRSYNDEVHGFAQDEGRVGGSGDQNAGQMHSFVNHSNADGVAVSTDGVNFVPIWTPSAGESNSSWYGVQLNSVDAAIAQALNLAGANGSLSTVTFRLQQYDDYAKSTDGRGWDWFTIYGTEKPPGAPGVVPEPSSFVLLGIGAMGLVGYGWRRRKTRKVA